LANDLEADVTRPEFLHEGVAAYERGNGFLDNPYLDEQSDRTRHWVDGYVMALIYWRERPKGSVVTIKLPRPA
jgi:hypothetical protein